MDITNEEAIEMAAEVFNPNHLHPGSHGITVISVVEQDMAYELVGFEGAACKVKDPMSGEETTLIGTLVDPYVVRKIIAVFKGCGLPLRPGETKEEAMASMGKYQGGMEVLLHRLRNPVN